jgi:hypothetical protein
MATLNFTQKAHSLKLPTHLHDRVHPYVRAHQKSEQQQAKSPENAPFARQIDFWCLAIAFAVAQGLPPDAAMTTAKFVDTRAVDFPQSLASLLGVLAVDVYGTEDERIEDPAAVIDLANQYAAAGSEPLLDLLDKSFPGLPMHKLLESLSDLADRTVGDVSD